jgi:predicted transcriptional regulator
MLYELVPDKNIGVNALRSMYTSYCMLSTNYLKKINEEETTKEKREMIRNDNIRQTEAEEEVKRPRDRKQYLQNYYQQIRKKIKEQIKENEKNKTFKIRL